MPAGYVDQGYVDRGYVDRGYVDGGPITGGGGGGDIDLTPVLEAIEALSDDVAELNTLVTVQQTDIDALNTLIVAQQVTIDALQDSVDGIATAGITLTDDNIADIVAAVQAVSGGIIAAQDANAFYIREGDTWSQDVDGLGNVTGKTIFYSMKVRTRDTDAQAIVTLSSLGGLVRLNGAATDGPTAAMGSITVLDATAGDIRLRLESDITVQLTSGTYVDAIKLLTDGNDISVRHEGETIVSAGVINAIT